MRKCTAKSSGKSGRAYRIRDFFFFFFARLQCMETLRSRIVVSHGLSIWKKNVFLLVHVQKHCPVNRSDWKNVALPNECVNGKNIPTVEGTTGSENFKAATHHFPVLILQPLFSIHCDWVHNCFVFYFSLRFPWILSPNKKGIHLYLIIRRTFNEKDVISSLFLNQNF